VTDVRRGSASIAANPVLIGAATTLVVIVAVFLAYNANSGLPFVPTYELKAEVPSAASLVKGNEVRIGGTRVGAVETIEASVDANGQARAVLTMKLERAVMPLPVDTTVLVRARSVLGLKYVQLTKGNSEEGFEDGATIPLRQATPEPVEFDEFLQTFDDPTREAQQANLTEFGNGFAGRGQDLNRLFESLPALLRDIRPVMRNLSDPETRLARLFQVLGRTAAQLAPAAEAQASLFRNLDTTLQAFADVSRPYLQEAIEEAPAALDTATREFPRQRPFLRDSERLFAELRPGARALRSAAPPLADAISAGTTTLERSTALNRRLGTTFTNVQALTTDPLALVGLGDLTTISELAAPLVGHIKPIQTTCNYVSLFLRNAGSLLSDGGTNGTWQRFIVIGAPTGPNNEGGAASATANGGGAEGNYLHSNPMPFTASPGQEKENECEAGNERYPVGRQVIGNPPGVQGTKTEVTRNEVVGNGEAR
jgi:virulence factor Mce-like protein